MPQGLGDTTARPDLSRVGRENALPQQLPMICSINLPMAGGSHSLTISGRLSEPDYNIPLDIALVRCLPDRPYLQKHYP